jgi:uncharacterized membrane protein (DUF2068 family)
MNVEAENESGSHRQGRTLIRLIGVMKLTSGLLMAAAGFGLFRLVVRGELGESLEHAALRLHLDPENRLVHRFIAAAAGLDRAKIWAIEAGAFCYATLHAVEGTGLLLLRPWAEYLTVVATASLLPLELYEVARKPVPLRLAILAVNLLVVGYLTGRLSKQRRFRATEAGRRR